MRLTEDERRNVAPDDWVLSTNRPYRLVANLWAFTGALVIVNGILYYVVYFTFPFAFFPFMAGLVVALILAGACMLAGAAFLYHGSRTVHATPFPQGTRCSPHTKKMAYDRCALCGALRCANDLVRIRQSRWFSLGMFAFDGVACQDCARRRFKGFRAASTGFLCLALPFILVSAAGMLMQWPSQVAGLFGVIVGSVIPTLLSIGFAVWRKGWHVVTTPLSEQPALMTPTSSRLAQRAMVGGGVRFKRVAGLST